MCDCEWAVRHDHYHAQVDKFDGHSLQMALLIVSPAPLDRDILAFEITRIGKAATEFGHGVPT